MFTVSNKEKIDFSKKRFNNICIRGAQYLPFKGDSCTLVKHLLNHLKLTSEIQITIQDILFYSVEPTYFSKGSLVLLRFTHLCILGQHSQLSKQK